MVDIGIKAASVLLGAIILWSVLYGIPTRATLRITKAEYIDVLERSLEDRDAVIASYATHEELLNTLIEGQYGEIELRKKLNTKLKENNDLLEINIRVLENKLQGRD